MSYLDRQGEGGLYSWVTSTDHKRIGLLYLTVMTVLFWVAVALGIVMRLKHLSGGDFLISARAYNALFTVHGVIMVFMFVIPGLPAVFGNFFLPILIGAKDVSFPRLNLLSWWLFLTGACLAVLSLFTGSGAPDTGWTFYVPFSIRTGTNVSLAVFAAFVLGLSSILTGLNFITTIHRMRCEGMTWHRMPLFAWAIYSTGWIQVLATPIIGITLLLVILERAFGIGVFDPAKGGDPLLYQHLFWIYSHPAVYIMIVPAMGAVTEIIPTFARRCIFGYKAIAYSSLAIAALGSVVWAHHMFTSGMADLANIIFSLLTFLVAIPSAIKVFNWTATLYKGSVDMQPSMLYALTFVFLFSIGGLSGVMQGALGLNVHLHDTYWIVGHFHYVMFGGTGFAFFAALLYWFPKMFGKQYDPKPAYAAWALMFLGFNMLYGSFMALGYMGMPRRYFAHLPQFHSLHIAATVGSWALVAGLAVFYANLLIALRRGKPAEADPWGGKTLEWTLPSPPPPENFDKLPVVTEAPYHYNPKAPA
ncbi:MAG: cbb3-type cytochrome c oxidase subunit I [Elusimicrobia bacterium]|nr:cbb3-type cytochrome c oxidase subunit I [Elusimicrobiota bacterium]